VAKITTMVFPIAAASAGARFNVFPTQRDFRTSNLRPPPLSEV
jgi:hypothetical protein